MKPKLLPRPKRLARWGILLGVLMAAAELQAAVLARSGLLEVASSSPGLGSAFQTGDVFSYSFSFDDAVTDMDSDADYGEFTGALVSLTILPVTARPGIWQPVGTMGAGTVYTERGAPFSWSLDAYPNFGFGPAVSGFTAVLLNMGFGGLPDNFDSGGGQTLGQVTGNLLDFISPSNTNRVELAFEQGMLAEAVSFELTTFHAPEPSRAVLMLAGMMAIFSRRKRLGRWTDRAAGLGGGSVRPVTSLSWNASGGT